MNEEKMEMEILRKNDGMEYKVFSEYYIDKKIACQGTEARCRFSKTSMDFISSRI